MLSFGEPLKTHLHTSEHMMLKVRQAEFWTKHLGIDARMHRTMGSRESNQCLVPFVFS